MQKWKQTWQGWIGRAEHPPLKWSAWPIRLESSCSRVLGMLRARNRGWRRALKPLPAMLCHSNLYLCKHRWRERLWYNFVRYSWEITVPNSHCQRVLVFSQINIAFEFRFDSLVEFSSQISQPLCYFKFSYYFSVLMKINE